VQTAFGKIFVNFVTADFADAHGCDTELLNKERATDSNLRKSELALQSCSGL
jgi:hypothetical protein